LVVLIHGLSVPYFIWDVTAPELAQAGFKVLRYDLYGRGFSDRPDVIYDLQLYRRQLHGLLSALKLQEPASLVGISIGAEIAADFVDHFPQNVNKLCLISPMGFPVLLPDSIKIMYIPGFGDYIYTVAGSRLMISSVEKDVLSGLTSDYVKAYKEQMQYKGFRHAILSTVRNVSLNDMQDLYKKIGTSGTPVLLIWGTKDTVTPYSNSAIATRLMPGVRFHPVHGAGHAPHLEQAEQVHRTMIQFLQTN
jgi:pimeloyl-ACP methyl ester carboxylesterase